MRRFAMAVFTVLVLLISTVHAEPATQPIAQSAVPSTQPVCDVYLTPFTALGGDTSLEWAGKAVSQNLLTDLARAKFHPLAAESAAASSADAQTAAKAVGAKYLITGTYQTAELQVRFNGQLIDVATGNVMGGLSVTGSPRDLFALEDSLSTQAIDALTQIIQLPVPAKNKPAAPLPAALAPAAVALIIQPPAVAAPNNGSSFEGSALQAYVDSNRTPSTDFAQQAQDAQDRENFGLPYYYGYSSYGPYLGSYGYGLGFGYSIPSAGYFGNHHGYSHGRY